jgi:hypothetical protein
MAKSGSGILQLGYWNSFPMSESLQTFFWVKKILKFFDADPGSGIFLPLDPGSGMEQFGSGINIPDLLHCQKKSKNRLVIDPGVCPTLSKPRVVCTGNGTGTVGTATFLLAEPERKN